MRGKPEKNLREFFEHLRQAISILEDLLPSLRSPIAPAPQHDGVTLRPDGQPAPSNSRPQNLTKLAYSLKEVCQLAAVGRSMLYAEIAEGRLRAVKRGKRTLILTGDLQDWIARWPASR